MAFIGTFCSPSARCKVELFIKYPHTSLISQSIKTPACSFPKQAGVSFFFYPRYYQPFRSILCAAYHAAPFFVHCVGIGFRYRLCRHLSTVSCARALRTRGSFFLIVPTDNQHLHRGTFLPFLQKW